MSDRYIVHLDMDAFFAAVEQRDDPALRGKPVVVGADPKAGHGRGVVSTCSYQARAYGIHSAMPISIAYLKCPKAVFLPVDIGKYEQVSGQIFKILSDFTPKIEQVSIDEVFLDISQTWHLFGNPVQTCILMKERIKKEIGLTASIGLAPTKMAAKIASGLKKPDGLVEVNKDKLLDFLWPLDIGLLWGVGKKTKPVLNQMSIYTVGDLAKRKREELIRVFGKNGEWFWEMGQGIDESEVVTEHEVKSIGNETTFESDTADRTVVERELARLCELVSGRLRKENFKCRTLTLKIRLEGFQTYTRSRTLDNPTNFFEEMIAVIKQLYADFGTKKRIRLVGVRASGLCPADEAVLFTSRGHAKKESVHTAIEKIREKFGGSAICRASSRD